MQLNCGNGIIKAAILLIIVLLCALIACAAALVRGRRSKLAAEREADRLRLDGQEYELLAGRLSSGFLLEALDMARGLAETNAKKSRRMLDDLHGYMRCCAGAIAARGGMRSFGEELQAVRHYISMKRALTGSAIDCELEIACMDFLMPSMTMQPIAEAAFDCCMEKKTGRGVFSITAFDGETHHVVIIEYNGAAPGDCEQVKRRLADCGDNRIEISAQEDGSTRVTLSYVRNPRENTEAL